MYGDASVLLGEPGRLHASEDAALRLQAQGHFGHGLGGAPEVDDACARHPEAGHRATVGFDVLDRVPGDALEALDLVLDAEAVDLLQHRQLVLGGGGDDLAADVVVDTVFLGERDELMAPLDAVDGLEAARGVVEPAVDDPAVVACLVVAQDGLLFKQGDAGLRVSALQLEEGGGTDDAAPHHDAVELAL